MIKFWLLKMIHMKLGGVLVEKTDEKVKLFSKKELLEKWLIDHGFVYGKCEDFISDDTYWFHQKDSADNHVVVEIEELIIDNNDEKIEWIDALMYRGLR